MVRKHIVFSGRVQGVGFRFTACSLARPLGLTGWVRNCCDGDVEMEVQGEEEAIDRLIRGLDRGRYIVIRKMEVKELPLDREEREFREVW
ncbi:MAG TPA: acylphosphatase [Candidatus Enterocloster faecavium]|uniref:acylphosphatase n=1 Tax=Candidatus Enterocloster faecavium TaxID=2838560 RepID=A0A9D2L769_9FIRM|nr:acylphosphatase [Candidatus Enterocloster faecavium]